MRSRTLILLGIALFALSLDAAPRRRAVQKRTPYDQSTIAGWLAANAYPLSTAEFVPYTGDLQPLRAMIGTSDVVAIGDGTHGTHEFFTIKLRIIDMLVRELGFDVIAFEAPLPLMNRLDAYVQTGTGDPRALLHELHDLYFFWDVEELVDVLEWMREYNAHRGTRPAVHVAGFDVLEPYAASREVIAYLRTVDPATAVSVEQQYGCLEPATIVLPEGCEPAAVSIRNALASRQAELVPLSSAAAFHEALQHARVVVQSRHPVAHLRDDAMAENALWLREHRGTTRRMMVWAHNAHVSKTRHDWSFDKPMGRTLHLALGDDYFAAATFTATGKFLVWDFQNKKTVIDSFAAPTANAYETKFRESGRPYLLIPLRGAMPEWLSTAAPSSSAGSIGDGTVTGSLPLQYDAAIFIETTTPLTPLP